MNRPDGAAWLFFAAQFGNHVLAALSLQHAKYITLQIHPCLPDYL